MMFVLLLSWFNGAREGEHVLYYIPFTGRHKVKM